MTCWPNSTAVPCPRGLSPFAANEKNEVPVGHCGVAVERLLRGTSRRRSARDLGEWQGRNLSLRCDTVGGEHQDASWETESSRTAVPSHPCLHGQTGPSASLRHSRSCRESLRSAAASL